MEISWGNDRINLRFYYDDKSPVSLAFWEIDGDIVSFSTLMPIVDILASGTGHWLASSRLVSTAIGKSLRYASHKIDNDNDFTNLYIVMQCTNPSLMVSVHYSLAKHQTMIRSDVTVLNTDQEIVTLESVTSWSSSFGTLSNHVANPRNWELTEARYDWLGEGRWETTRLSDLLPYLHQELTHHTPRGIHRVISTGSWSTGEYVPLGILTATNQDLGWVFQVEHNGAWRWEIGDYTSDGYVALSGPTALDHGWYKSLQPGESFTTVPVSIAAVRSSIQDAASVLTRYRRELHSPESKLDTSVIFNDYMNTINGDPTTEKLLPLIKSAAQVGCEIFVIDCGWYDEDGDWWSTVGEWKPSTTRFPGGFSQIIQSIVDNGMIPGLWLEPDVIGINSPVANQLPDAAFFQRNGKRVIEQDRYILDFRNAEAREYILGVVSRLVQEFGIGYFKFDYNVSPDAGTDYQVESIGEGMLEHNRAYTALIEEIYRRHPGIILENCSSGGMREDFVQTSHFQVQSTSDQQDEQLYPPIATTAPLMMLPEQAANWAYPNISMDNETFAATLNMTMLGRFFLSGYLNKMDVKQQQIVSYAIEAYKQCVAPMLHQCEPVWPLGLPLWNDTSVALGMFNRSEQTLLCTVWVRQEKSQHIRLALPYFSNSEVEICDIFPVNKLGFSMWDMHWNKKQGILTIDIPQYCFASRTFKVSVKGGATFSS